MLFAIPAAAVGFRSSALIMRLTRSSMLEVLRQDYVRTARSKGMPESSVTFDHALRNALLPVITTIGIETAILFGGLIVTETVFNIPGVARFLVEAIRWRDYPMVQNLVMFIAVVVVTVNLIVDLLYMLVDPRIRYRNDVGRVPRPTAMSTALAKPPITAPTWRGELAHLAGRYPLGVAGAFILLVFVFAAIFAGTVAPLDPFSTNPVRPSRPTGQHPSVRRRRHGPRPALPPDPWRAHLARRVAWRHHPGQRLRHRDRPRLRLHRRLVRPDRAASDRDHAGAAAAGHGTGHHRLSRPLAHQHHRRHRHPADPQRRARHSLQRAVAARTAVRRSRPGRRHGRRPHRRSARAAEHAGAADRARHRATRLHHPDRGVPFLPRPRRAGTVSRPGAACCRNPPPNMSAPRPGW